MTDINRAFDLYMSPFSPGYFISRGSLFTSFQNHRDPTTFGATTTHIYKKYPYSLCTLSFAAICATIQDDSYHHPSIYQQLHTDVVLFDTELLRSETCYSLHITYPTPHPRHPEKEDISSLCRYCVLAGQHVSTHPLNHHQLSSCLSRPPLHDQKDLNLSQHVSVD